MRSVKPSEIMKKKLLRKPRPIDPKAFYQYVNSKTNIQTCIADLNSDDGHVLATNRDKAELFNRFFRAYSQWKTQTICPQYH